MVCGGGLRKSLEICGIRVMSRWVMENVYMTGCAQKVWA